MRAQLWGAVLAGAAGLIGAVCVSGCEERLDGCVNDLQELRDARDQRVANSLLMCMPVSFGEGGSGGGGGGEGGCVPTEDDAPVSDTCGIFVSSSLGNDNSNGTKMAPVRKLSKALELAEAAGRPVFACGEVMVEEPTGIVVKGGMRIYGGLDCAAAPPNTWIRRGALTTEVSAPSDQVPMRLEKGSGTELHALHVNAKSATAPGKPSIAVIANEVTARFVSSTVQARDGAPGVDGATPQTPVIAGQNGTKGESACMVPMVFGGIGPSNGCSVGGDGGSGSPDTGFTGTSGSPADGAPNYGLGETSLSLCTHGGDGPPGAPGTAGLDGSGLGTLNTTDGHVGVSGQAGGPGAPGKGGGGGGGTRSVVSGTNQCPGGMNGGASGGSGASGGCGGAGGVGGTSGGSSIGVISFKSMLTFEGSKIIAGKGAEPGHGSQGQDGGPGGAMGGLGGASSGVVKAGCNGGRGGQGGKGGNGGNGVGGHSIGIAYLEIPGMPPFLLAGTDIKFDTKSTNGVATSTQKFE